MQASTESYFLRLGEIARMDNLTKSHDGQKVAVIGTAWHEEDHPNRKTA
jgi:hypothetical protein